jgi:hypothetical protein
VGSSARCTTTNQPTVTTTTEPGALALHQGTQLSLQVRSVHDLTQLARVFAASGMFNRNNSPEATLAQCSVQLLAGMEAGFTPFASITGIYVVNGKPGFSAQLLAQAIKRHPDYDYRVIEKTDQACSIRFLSRGEVLGVEVFTMAMADRAKLTGKGGPWSQYPEAMLFARCLTAGMRTHCPDALGGHTPYTPEELGAPGQIDEQGMVTVSVSEAPASAPAITPAPAGPLMLTTPEELAAGALRAATKSGLTPAGITAMVQELSHGEVSTLEDLPLNVLARLAKNGLLPTTVARCNSAATAEPEPELEPEEDDLPVAWVA